MVVMLWMLAVTGGVAAAAQGGNNQGSQQSARERYGHTARSIAEPIGIRSVDIGDRDHPEHESEAKTPDGLSTRSRDDPMPTFMKEHAQKMDDKR